MQVQFNNMVCMKISLKAKKIILKIVKFITVEDDYLIKRVLLRVDVKLLNVI